MSTANPKPPSTELRPLVFVVVVPERELLLVIPAAPAVKTRLDNIEYFPPNFEGLVLGCIDADFCK